MSDLPNVVPTLSLGQSSHGSSSGNGKDHALATVRGGFKLGGWDPAELRDQDRGFRLLLAPDHLDWALISEKIGKGDGGVRSGTGTATRGPGTATWAPAEFGATTAMGSEGGGAGSETGMAACVGDGDGSDEGSGYTDAGSDDGLRG
ncbi:hypothetical protein GUJ93_ZPchr0011g28460 [Zizania palustris]|uniref:Uncharacterized protein n=1 Tax=Zizania palustris TaxID=103762 RepID=A0A8J5WH45_ZIZPA|nr:hypothetical protein GUJ93_ZPchr0011g28460 [Zizania palustris]